MSKVVHDAALQRRRRSETTKEIAAACGAFPKSRAWDSAERRPLKANERVEWGVISFNGALEHRVITRIQRLWLFQSN
jgi:hypothetical protein